MRAIKLFIITICLFTTNSLEAFGMELKLFRSENELFVYLINDTESSLKVNKRFSIGSPNGVLNEISFVIKDSASVTMPFIAKVQVRIAQKSDVVTLEPGSLVGRRIYIKSLFEQYYDLKVGIYKIRAIYKNKYSFDSNVFGKELKSNLLVLDVNAEMLAD